MVNDHAQTLGAPASGRRVRSTIASTCYCQPPAEGAIVNSLREQTKSFIIKPVPCKV